MTTTMHHYAEYGTLAVCGQLADGMAHTTESAALLRGFSRLVPAHVCPTCLAIANESLASADSRESDERTRA